MGKAKKRSKTASQQLSGSYIDKSHANNPVNELTELEDSLSSIDESKRIDASLLLVNIISTGNEKNVATLSTSRFLSKISMRLLDNSFKVIGT